MEFKGDAIEVFFKVFVNLGKDSMFVLNSVFNSSSKGESDICAGFILAIGKDGVGESTSKFNATVEGVSNDSGKVGLNGVHDCDGPTLSGVRFGDGDTGHMFGSARDDTADKAEIDEFVVAACPIFV